MTSVNSAMRWSAFLARHPMPFYAAHRGRQTDRNPENMAPENTRPALRLANASKTPSEFDVLSTVDGHIIVHHDDETGRVFELPGKQKRISQITWNELRTATLNALAYENKVSSITGMPYKIPEKLQTERIAELDEALDASPDTPLFIELKPEKNTPENFEKHVYEIVQKKGALDRVVFLSFSRDSLKRLRKLDPNILLMLNYSLPKPFHWLEKNPLWLRLYIPFIARQFDGLNPCYQTASTDFVRLCHQYGLQTRPWVYHETREEELNAFPRLKQLKVDGVITNAIDLAQDYFDKKQG